MRPAWYINSVMNSFCVADINRLTNFCDEFWISKIREKKMSVQREQCSNHSFLVMVSCHAKVLLSSDFIP